MSILLIFDANIHPSSLKKKPLIRKLHPISLWKCFSRFTNETYFLLCGGILNKEPKMLLHEQHTCSVERTLKNGL